MHASLYIVHKLDELKVSIPTGIATKPGLWTLDWTMNWLFEPKTCCNNLSFNYWVYFCLNICA